MTTQTVDREALRSLIQGLPTDVQGHVAGLWREHSWPTLKPEGVWPPTLLMTAACAIVDAAARLGVKGLTVPYLPEPTAAEAPEVVEVVEVEEEASASSVIDTGPIFDRIKALPDDLADLAADEAAKVPIPNVHVPEKWTVHHVGEADRILGWAEGLAADRLRWIMAAFSANKWVTDDLDALRHSFVAAVTNGRTESAKKLTGPEARYFAAWCNRVAVEGCKEGPAAYVPDWKAEAKAQGVTQADLLKAAKAWAADRRLDKPSKLDAVTDHRMIAAILATSTDGLSDAELAAEVIVGAAAAKEVPLEQAEALAAKQRPVTPAPSTEDAAATPELVALAELAAAGLALRDAKARFDAALEAVGALEPAS